MIPPSSLICAIRGENFSLSLVTPLPLALELRKHRQGQASECRGSRACVPLDKSLLALVVVVTPSAGRDGFAHDHEHRRRWHHHQPCAAQSIVQLTFRSLSSTAHTTDLPGLRRTSPAAAIATPATCLPRSILVLRLCPVALPAVQPGSSAAEYLCGISAEPESSPWFDTVWAWRA